MASIAKTDSGISIHSLRMEGDIVDSLLPLQNRISIHSLRMEGDSDAMENSDNGAYNFNPLPPHGGRRYTHSNIIYTNYISIHSLRMEGDNSDNGAYKTIMSFQSTPSAWRETYPAFSNAVHTVISIHSLRMEGDCNCFLCQCCYINISIHSLRMEGDLPVHKTVHFISDYFNPLPPHGGRLQYLSQFYDMIQISIHSLRMEGDSMTTTVTPANTHFNPLPPHGGRRSIIQQFGGMIIFQSTPSAWRETNMVALILD